jgi:hypothetical protein
MMTKVFAAGTALLAAASALPSSLPTSKWNAIPQLARFDNKDGIPLVAASDIGIYLDIYWQGMTLVNTGNLQNIASVTPNSPPNYAAFSALDTGTVIQGRPSMMTNYDDSTVDHFDLESFYYGCAVASQASIVGVPFSCDITIKGYADDAGTQQVAEEKYGFTVGGITSALLGKVAPQETQLRAQMLKATPSKKFYGVKRVDFYVSKDLVTAGLVDTVQYTVYSDKSISP